MHVKYETTKSIIDESKGFSEKYILQARQIIVESLSRTAKPFCNKYNNLELIINEDQLNQVIIDAVEDLKRVIDFHPTEKPNQIKEASYIAYWWVRRKPAFFNNDIYEMDIPDKDKAKLIFFNEITAVAYLLSTIFNLETTNPICDKTTEAYQKWDKEWSEARKYLTYFLVYRAKTAKSVEAFLYSSILQPLWNTTKDFWEYENEEEN